MIRRYLAGVLLLACVLPAGLAGQIVAADDAGPVVSSFALALESVAAQAEVPTAVTLPFEAVTPQVTGRSGRTYMIAGAAALVGGLLVGGDLGTLIAGGGVVLAVYGIILYY